MERGFKIKRLCTPLMISGRSPPLAAAAITSPTNQACKFCTSRLSATGMLILFHDFVYFICYISIYIMLRNGKGKKCRLHLSFPFLCFRRRSMIPAHSTATFYPLIVSLLLQPHATTPTSSSAAAFHQSVNCIRSEIGSV